MNDHQRLGLIELIEKLRSITLAVQVTPFIYTAIFIAVLSVYPFAGEKFMCIIDATFYVSPAVCVQFIVLSKALRLCRWHKMACVLPITPQIPIVLDATVVDFSNCAAKVLIATTILMAALLLVAAYNVFLKPKDNERKRRTNRDSRLLEIQTEKRRMHDGRD